MVALAGIIGLAIDGGELYRKRVILQKSADAAAIATLGQLIAKHPQDWPSDGQELLPFVYSHLITNLKLNGVNPRDGELTFAEDPTIDLSRERVTIKPQLKIKLVLMGLLGSARDTVSVNSEAEIGPGLLSLVIDTSSSMLCKVDAAGNSVCPCFETDTTGGLAGTLTPECVTKNQLYKNAVDSHGGPAQTNLQKVKEAVQDVVERINYKRDRISLVPFNLVADVAVPTQVERDADGKTFDPAQVKHAVNNLELYTDPVGVPRVLTQSATNICDGLIRSYLDAMNATQGVPGLSSNVTYLFFSDGAPTASRLFLGESNGEQSAAGAKQPIPFDSAAYDAAHNGFNIPPPFLEENNYTPGASPPIPFQPDGGPPLPPSGVLPNFLKYDYTLWSLKWRTTEWPINWPMVAVGYPAECGKGARCADCSHWPSPAVWSGNNASYISCDSFVAQWETEATSPLVKTQNIFYGHQQATPPRLLDVDLAMATGSLLDGTPLSKHAEDVNGDGIEDVSLAAIQRMERVNEPFHYSGEEINLYDWYGGVVPTCSWLSVHASPTSFGSMYDSLGRCVHHLGFHLPSPQTTLYANDPIVDANPLLDIKRQFYKCPIAMSDVMRASGGTLFTVGLGADPLLTCQQDVYQDVSEEKRRKDCFLRRIAFDPTWKGADNKVGTADDDRQMSFANYTTYETLEAQKRKNGDYLSTSDPSKVDEFFTVIIQRMKLRLIK